MLTPKQKAAFFFASFMTALFIKVFARFDSAKAETRCFIKAESFELWIILLL